MEKKVENIFNFEKKTLNSAKNILKKYNKDESFYKDYDSLLKEYSKLLKHSEDILKVEDEKEKIIQNTQKNLKRLLDSTGQGFLSFGKDLLIEKEYSKACENFLGKNIAGKSCIDIIFKKSEEGIEEDIFTAVFADYSKAEIYISLLPESFVLKSKNINCEYKITGKGSNMKILCIFTDITEKQILRSKLEEERANLKMLITVMMRQDTIKRYIRDYKEYFTYRIFEEINFPKKSHTILQNIYKEIHTFKGSFGQWYMNTSFKNLHNLENEINELMLKSISKEELMQYIVSKDFNSLIMKDINYIKDQLGKDMFDKEEYLWVKKKDLLSIEEMMKKYLFSDEYEYIVKEIRRLRYKSFKEVFEHFKDYLKSSAEKYGKRVDSFNIETSEEILVDEDAYHDFIKSLIHIFRNILAHGIEYPERRLYLGKTEGGNITCKIMKLKSKIYIEISDDGAGMDLELLKKYALAKGFYDKEELVLIKDEEVFDLLFQGKFSTKSTANEIAGRGIGLAIVKNEIDKLEGKISIETQRGKGTKFKISLSDYDFFKRKQSFDFHILMSNLSDKLQVFLKEELKLKLMKKDKKHGETHVEFLDYNMLIDIKGKNFYTAILSADSQSGEEIMKSFVSDTKMLINKEFYIRSSLGEILNNIAGVVTQELEIEGKYLEIAPSVSLIDEQFLLRNKIDIVAQEIYIKSGKVTLTLIERIDI